MLLTTESAGRGGRGKARGGCRCKHAPGSAPGEISETAQKLSISLSVSSLSKARSHEEGSCAWWRDVSNQTHSANGSGVAPAPAAQPQVAACHGTAHLNKLVDLQHVVDLLERVFVVPLTKVKQRPQTAHRAEGPEVRAEIIFAGESRESGRHTTIRRRQREVGVHAPTEVVHHWSIVANGSAEGALGHWPASPRERLSEASKKFRAVSRAPTSCSAAGRGAATHRGRRILRSSPPAGHAPLLRWSTSS